MNNADYGLSLQKVICDEYNLDINEWAVSQFEASYNSEYRREVLQIIPTIFEKIGSTPYRFLTYTKAFTNNKQSTSPHNFLLKNGKTLSIRTTRGSDKVAPKTVGQAGFSVLNDYFSDIFGGEITNQADVRKLMLEHIHEVLPVFIDNLFQSDYTVFVNRQDIENIQVIRAEELANYSFSRDEFEFTRGMDIWTESTTLKFHGKSIAEIQTHKERTFKFRFIVSSIPYWINVVKETNETLGMSAEAAICDFFELEKPLSFNKRVLQSYVEKLMPVVGQAFMNMPPAIKHSGSLAGERGAQSKCSYDFVLLGNEKLSLKTNKGKMVCPPEVGQPGSQTCLLYFAEFFAPGTDEVSGDNFKEMVFTHIADIMPIYVNHLFDSDWLLWIYETPNGFEHREINRADVKEFVWEKSRFSFTKNSVAEWNDSNTVKYDGISIGEFQVHRNRNCFKFRFNMQNLVKILIE